MLVLRYRAWHSPLTADHDLVGVQKYHAKPVPRIGGVSLMAAMVATCIAAAQREPQVLPELVLLLGASIPAFLGGLAEDLTKRVRVIVRLGLAMLSALLAYYLLGAAVTRVDIIGLDWLLGFGLISLIFTMVAVSGAIGFVGLIVPHAARMLVGTDHRRVLPVAALAGALLLVLVDLVARTAFAPMELPVGVITSLIGGPFFVWMLVRQPVQGGRGP